MKKVFSIISALVLCAAMWTSANAETKTLYCKMTQSWWTTDGAAIGVYAYNSDEDKNAVWPGVRMTPVSGETGLWSADVDTKYAHLIFVRVNPTGDIADWGAKTGDLAFPTGENNLYTITSETAVWGDPGCTGVWSKLGGPTPKYYITGDSALMVDLKLDKALAWNPAAIPVTEADAYKLSGLKVGQTYCVKVTVNGTWDEGMVKGYAALTDPKPAGVKTDGNGNIVFQLSEAGDVTITYTATAFSIDGKFYVAPAAKYFITGDSALVVDAGLTADKKWDPAAIAVTEEDAYVIKNLKANQEYKLKVTLDGTWDHVKGYSDLTDPKPAGVKPDADGNLVFKMAEAGDVTVTYTATAFTIAGKFETLPTAKYFITGDSALIVDAGLTADKKWNPAAIPVMDADAYVIKNLKANQQYVLKVTLDGTWADGMVKGFEALTTKPAGVSTDKDDNIVFTLDEAGDVTVTYTATAFTIDGKFHALPAAKYYITGDSALVVDAGLTADKKWNPAAIPVMDADAYVIKNLKANQQYVLKVTLDGTWADGMVKGYGELTTRPEGISTDKDDNIVFKLSEAGDVTVTYNATVFTVEGKFVAPEPVEKDWFIKLPVAENDWTWRAMDKQIDGTWTHTTVWVGGGANIHTEPADEGAKYIKDEEMDFGANLVAPEAGTQCTFIWNPATEKLAVDYQLQAIENVELNINAPMYNIFGVEVDATFKGVVIQNGHKYIR